MIETYSGRAGADPALPLGGFSHTGGRGAVATVVQWTATDPARGHHMGRGAATTTTAALEDVDAEAFMGFVPTVSRVGDVDPPRGAYPRRLVAGGQPNRVTIVAQAPWDNVRVERYPRERVASHREYTWPRGHDPTVVCLRANDDGRAMPQLVVPDGCVDLLWISTEGVIVAGADTGPRTVQPLGEPVAGIRLRPGAAGAVLGMPASEVRDQQVDLSDVWGPRTALITTAAVGPAARLRLLTREVVRRRAAPDRLVAAAARALAHPSARVGQVAEELGVSERHLRRRTLDAIGYGPKTLARVARLRHLIALDGEDLAIRAVLAGYASQAHMSEEVRRLTGRTPVRFLNDARVTADYRRRQRDRGGVG